MKILSFLFALALALVLAPPADAGGRAVVNVKVVNVGATHAFGGFGFHQRAAFFSNRFATGYYGGGYGYNSAVGLAVGDPCGYATPVSLPAATYRALPPVQTEAETTTTTTVTRTRAVSP